MNRRTGITAMGRKLASIAASVALAASLCPGAALASELQAGSAAGQSGQATQKVSAQASKNLEQLGVKFDLKPGKAASTTMYLAGASKNKVGYSVKLTGLKVANAKKKGYKQATFTLSFGLKKGLTKSQQAAALKKFAKEYYRYGAIAGDLRFFVLDYATGQNLEDEQNAAKVTVSSKTKKEKMAKYSAADGSWFTIYKTWQVACTVTYPSSYKDLCVGLGGDPLCQYNGRGEDRDFLNTPGTNYRYKDTTWYKKGKNNFHFMRVQ